ncbi:DUF3299 domain-containing protein [Rubrivivax sp. A210]|uniref:DUF3299 domain-containing protein n=1 Tax=Rubrivivax sp. A210 TaxID=2772301 RepID=UPI00191B5794|nr:DUF3299 domain-containing protein [Rubrivivax sp. A210]
MLRLTLIAAALLAQSALAQAQAAKDGVPLMKPPLAAPAAPAAPKAAAAEAFQTIKWEALVPADWDPFKEFKGLDMQAMQDGDPRANEMLKRMREVWDSAPVNTAMVGQAVRLPGFVVPLEEGKDGMKEFLLVPYFGACIHSPPPPANQIVHVLPRSPAKGVRSMDPVWISGVLRSVKTDSYMGAAGYRIEAVSVAPYSEKAR